MATGEESVQCSYVQMRQRSILLIPKMSDKYNTQVEASIKAKGQLYCYLSVTRLLSEVVAPAHLETVCSQRVLGSKMPCFTC